MIDVQLEIYGSDRADCRDHKGIAYRLRPNFLPNPGFHSRIVRWT